MSARNISDKIISDALDISEFEEVSSEAILNQKPTDVDDDYNIARDNLKTILTKGSDALDEMINVALLSQNPRSYEVVSTLIKTLSDTNKDLLELSEKKNRIEKGKNQDQNKTINNNLYISTNELMKLINKK